VKQFAEPDGQEPPLVATASKPTFAWIETRPDRDEAERLAHRPARSGAAAAAAERRGDGCPTVRQQLVIRADGSTEAKTEP